MILSGDVDYKGSDVCGVSCIAPGDIGRRETIHVPTGPSSLDKINLVENAGECNADFVNSMRTATVIERARNAKNAAANTILRTRLPGGLFRHSGWSRVAWAAERYI